MQLIFLRVTNFRSFRGRSSYLFRFLVAKKPSYKNKQLYLLTANLPHPEKNSTLSLSLTVVKSMLKSKHIANAVLIQEWPIVDCCLPLVVVVTIVTFVTPTSSCSSSSIAAAAAVPSPVAAIEASLVLGLSAVTASGRRRHQIFRLGGSVVTCGRHRRSRSSLLWR